MGCKTTHPITRRSASVPHRVLRDVRAIGRSPIHRPFVGGGSATSAALGLLFTFAGVTHRAPRSVPSRRPRPGAACPPGGGAGAGPGRDPGRGLGPCRAARTCAASPRASCTWAWTPTSELIRRSGADPGERERASQVADSCCSTGDEGAVSGMPAYGTHARNPAAGVGDRRDRLMRRPNKHHPRAGPGRRSPQRHPGSNRSGGLVEHVLEQLKRSYGITSGCANSGPGPQYDRMWFKLQAYNLRRQRRRSLSRRRPLSALGALRPQPARWARWVALEWVATRATPPRVTLVAARNGRLLGAAQGALLQRSLLGERVRVRGLPGNRPWVPQRSPVGEGWGESLPGNHPRVPQRSLLGERQNLS